MIDIANNNQTFRKRVVRFFNSPKRADVLGLIKHLSVVGEVLVFGGLLRDIALFGAKSFNSDIDLVVDCPASDLSGFFTDSRWNVVRNKFGGYRLEVGGWTVDVWPVRETWAFKYANVKYIGRESLLRTTITNWDSVAYSFKDGVIISDPSYLDCLISGELDVVLIKNPNEVGVLTRLIKAICDKRAKILMPRLLNYLKEELPKWTANQIVAAQEDMLGKVYLSRDEYYSFRDEIYSLKEDLFGSVVLVKGRNLSFTFDG
ncbi:hypothetical protein [Pseudomonas sp. AK106]